MGVIDSVYDLEKEINDITCEKKISLYVKERFNEGKSLRKISTELGWSRGKLERFMNRAFGDNYRQTLPDD